MTMLTMQPAARMSPLSIDDMEQWAATRRVTPTEAFRIWSMANGYPDVAHDLWENDDSWTDARNLVLVGRNWIDRDAAVSMMDDDIREDLHRVRAWASEQDFVDAYCTVHLCKHGKEFRVG